MTGTTLKQRYMGCEIHINEGSFGGGNYRVKAPNWPPPANGIAPVPLVELQAYKTIAIAKAAIKKAAERR